MMHMLDSGSAVSLIKRTEISTCGDKITTLMPPPPLLKLITVPGEPLSISGCVRLPVKINQLQVVHSGSLSGIQVSCPGNFGHRFLAAT